MTVTFSPRLRYRLCVPLTTATGKMSTDTALIKVLRSIGAADRERCARIPVDVLGMGLRIDGRSTHSHETKLGTSLDR